MMHTGNNAMSAYSQLGLGREQLAAAKQERIEHTLKT